MAFLVVLGLVLPLLPQAMAGGGLANVLYVVVMVGMPGCISIGGLLYAFLAMRRGPWAYLYHGFAAASLLVFVLTLSLVLGIATNVKFGGLALSAAACWPLLLGRVGEARAVTGLTWRRTILYLITLRLHESRPAGHCPGCGYNLYGLREMRCPECGRAFTFEEIGATPESIGFAVADDTATAPARC